VGRPPDRQGADLVLLDGARARPAGGVELVVALIVVTLFTALHAASARDFAAATANALTVQAVERPLHLDVERATNAWLAGHAVLAQAAVDVYRSHYLVVVGVLAWTYVRHPEVYLQVRRTLVAMFALVLPVYWAFPLSPPRFALAGVVDIVAARSPIGSHATGPGEEGQSYTAMPSMHVGLSLWCAWAVWTALRGAHPRLALLAWLFPLTMTAVVLTTGNHYVLDVVGSVVLLVASVSAATLWAHHVGRRGVSPAGAPSPARPPAQLRRP